MHEGGQGLARLMRDHQVEFRPLVVCGLELLI
jgi:hypothetical protein